MSEEIIIWDKPEYKEWLQDIRTQHFFKDLNDIVNNYMECTKEKLFSQPSSRIDLEGLKNEITYCQAQLCLINYYNSLINNSKENAE